MKPTFRFLAPLALVVIFAAGLGGCGKETPVAPPPAAPLTEADVKLNAFEMLTDNYVKVAKKLKHGDVSVTVAFIDLNDKLKSETAKMQQEAAKMTPQERQRFAQLLGRSVPYIQ